MILDLFLNTALYYIAFYLSSINADLIPKLVDSNLNQNLFNAVDSDYFLIYQKPSTLPFENIGFGVFAKHNIPAKSIICEHRGFIIYAEDINKFPGNDKSHDMNGPDGVKYKNLGNNICAYINDCTAALYRPYTVEEWHAVNNSDYHPGVPCIDNFAYNAEPLYHGPGGKIFILSTREILAGEEIFYPYGWQYWKAKMTILNDNKLHKFVDTGNSMELLPVVEGTERT